jgi:DUF4097 and DUF4098 domain-containing protein YvlB
MRRCLVFLHCLFALNLLFSQEAPNTVITMSDGSYVEKEEKQFRFFPGGKMQIASEVPGSIRIIGWKKATVHVEAEKIVEGLSPEPAKEEIGKHPLRVRWNQTSANIQVSGIPEEAVAIRCNLTVYVPGDRTDMKATISQGDIYVEEVNGWVEITTTRGNLGASSMSGYFSGMTEQGDIRVDMSGKRWRGLEFGAMTRMGSIDLQLPEEYSAALKLETMDGEVTVDYPPRMVDGEPVPLTIGVRKKAQALDSLVGTGGAPITLVSNAGNIRLSVIKD